MHRLPPYDILILLSLTAYSLLLARAPPPASRQMVGRTWIGPSSEYCGGTRTIIDVEEFEVRVRKNFGDSGLCTSKFFTKIL